jgi:hypothetical protein
LPTAELAVSEPGAPGEPQRTLLRVGVVDPVQAIPLVAAKANGYLAQEALEPTFVQIPNRLVLPALVAKGLDVAVIDAATAIGERALGWNGIAVAAFGPAAEDRSVAFLVAEATFCQTGTGTCERIQRAARRGLAWAARLRGEALAEFTTRAGIELEILKALKLDEWWADCSPDPAALRSALEWGDAPSAVGLDGWLAWESPDAAWTDART